jgi:hypothetical protein
VLVACDGGQERQYHGVLYFGQGAYLMRYSLQDGSLSVAGHLGDTEIREVSALGFEYLLIAESALVNRRRVPRISWFDVHTGESADLYAGVHARFLPATEVIVYDDGSELFAVPQMDGSSNEVIFSHAQNELTHMVVASPDTLLFETVRTGEAVIRSWNGQTGELPALDGLAATCRLRGAVWIDALNRLACKRRGVAFDDANYVLSDLNGLVDGGLDLPQEKKFQALTYVSGQNILILQETFQGMLGDRDQYAVWIHDMQSGESHELSGNVNLGQSAVFASY